MNLNFLEQVFPLSTFTVFTTFIVLLLGVFYVIFQDKNLPPGPVGLPLLGYWPFFEDKTIHLQLQKIAKTYGDVSSFRVAGKLFINLGSIKAIKEAHITKSDAFSKRYTDYSVLSACFGKGVAVVNGEEWKILRKFFVQAFKEYGLTSMKDYLSGSIYDSVNAVVGTLRDTAGTPTNIISIINFRVLSNFRRMMFNDGEITEEEIQGILDAYGKLLNLFSGKNILLIGDFAKKFLFPRIECYEESIKSHRIIQGYLRKIIRRHEESFDKDSIRDIIDSYIKERNDRKNKGDPTAGYFSEDALVDSFIQFVGDGISSVAIFIAYFLDALLEYPEEQERIYKELAEVIGTDRGVTMEDKNKLPYTNAFMQEVMRMTDVFPYIPSLECTKETTLNGYKIPVGAITITNFYASHRDPEVFEDPDVFKPSRYITKPGKPRAELPLSFGVGKRSCAGESFTMMQVFLFLTTIVKNFTLSRPKGEIKKSFLDERMDVCACPRK